MTLRSNHSRGQLPVKDAPGPSRRLCGKTPPYREPNRPGIGRRGRRSGRERWKNYSPPFLFRAGLLLPFDLKPLTADIPGGLVAREREIGLLAGYRRKAAGGRGRIVMISGDAGVGKSSLLRQFELGVTAAVRFPPSPAASSSSKRRSVHSANCCRVSSATVRCRAMRERAPCSNACRSNAAPRRPLRSRRAGCWNRSMRRLRAAPRAAPSFFSSRTCTGQIVRRSAFSPISRIVSPTGACWSWRRIAATKSTRTTARLGDFATLLAKESVSQITLGPLDEGATQALIELALPHPDALDAATIADIVRRSQGNPFFAEELLKSVLERSPSDSHRRLPLSIRGAVLARAALLSEDERKILSLAAVLGERFSIERLVALCDGRRDDVLLALERAQALHLVYERQKCARRTDLSARADAGGALRRAARGAGAAAARSDRSRTGTACRPQRRQRGVGPSLAAGRRPEAGRDLRRARGRSGVRDRRDGRRDFVLRARAFGAQGRWCRRRRPRTQNRSIARFALPFECRHRATTPRRRPILARPAISKALRKTLRRSRPSCTMPAMPQPRSICAAERSMRWARNCPPRPLICCERVSPSTASRRSTSSPRSRS